jgi:hypothetical protein
MPDGTQAKKIIFAPNTPVARKLFEDQNTRLPTGLKMKIEVVPGYKPLPVEQGPNVSELQARIAELEMKLAAVPPIPDVVVESAKATNGTTGDAAKVTQKHKTPSNETA